MLSIYIDIKIVLNLKKVLFKYIWPKAGYHYILSIYINIETFFNSRKISIKLILHKLVFTSKNWQLVSDQIPPYVLNFYKN